MIIARIIGGLGNQMFQYAIGRRLSLKHNTKLKLDLKEYQKYKLRKFELFNFNIQAEIAHKDDLVQFINIPHNIPQKILYSLFPVKKKKNGYKDEKFYHFDKNILSLPDHIYLAGYWHSEKYFSDIKDILQQDFTLKKSLDQENVDILDRIKITSSVGVHVRIGDFLEDRDTNKLHGFYGSDYLKKAIKIIDKKVINPHFFIFSDDIDWVRNNLKTTHKAFYVTWNKKKDYLDMYLMSNCHHNIIVNSTFGWWGAYLNKNRQKIVITPKKWYQKEPSDTQDLLPKSWIKI